MKLIEKLKVLKDKNTYNELIIKEFNLLNDTSRLIYWGSFEDLFDTNGNNGNKAYQYLNSLNNQNLNVKFLTHGQKVHCEFELSNSTDLKNPKELVSVVRQQTFFVESALTSSKGEEDGDEPLNIYNNTFARFGLVLINKNKKAAVSSINIKEIPDIIKKSEFAYNKELNMSINKATAQQKTEVEKQPAYTVKISSGILKNKTPAQALIEDPKNFELLQKQYNWLKSNLGKYPKNKTQMDAIVNAVNLYNKKELKNDLTTNDNSEAFQIYKSGFRYNIRKKREDGLCLIKETSISWAFDTPYPVNVEIKNYYAPVIKKEDGTVNVQAKDRKDLLVNSMNLTSSEWEYIIYMIKTNMRIFEDSMGQELLKKADIADKNKRMKFSKEGRETNNA